MSIRKCKKGDLEDVIKIEKDSFEYPYPDEVFYQYLGSDLFLVHEDDDHEVTGYVMGEKRDGYGIIVSIAVSPTQRLEGVGTSLMEAVQKAMDVDNFFVIVRPSNEKAVEFYKKLDFFREGKINDYYKNKESGIVMKKVKNRKS